MQGELFVATILKGGTSCIDQHGNKYAISGLVIIKADGQHVIYGKQDSFFKAVCMEGTKHEAKELENGKVNIY